MNKWIVPLWQAHRWLTVTCALMLCLFVINLIGVALDPRLIGGSPAWLKPAKFSLSVAIYTGSLAWILTRITIWPTFIKGMGKTTTAMLLVEIFIIDLQAWRGTTSHFNFRTPLDASLFGTMGLCIAILWLASAGVTVALFRQRFANQSLGWALRLGMLITVIGSASGGLMTRPMPGQTSKVIGSHTVGAPDGGAALPGTGWSANHGDLRIGHFVGLHGMQVIPIAYWLLSRKRRPRVSTIAVAAAGYFAGAVLLEWQAFRGQSVLQPDAITGNAWMAWLGLFAPAFLLTLLPPRKNTLQTASTVA